MASSKSRSGILIIGLNEDLSWSPDNLEEAWQLEKVYGPRPRWSIYVLPFETLQQPSAKSGVDFHIEQVSGLSVEVWSAVSVPRLRIELHGDAICVCEVDA
jgi:hypothetical protein